MALDNIGIPKPKGLNSICHTKLNMNKTNEKREPRKDIRRIVTGIRLSDSEMNTVQKAVKKEGRTVSDFLRFIALRESKKILAET